MTTTEKMKFFNLAGKEISSKLKAGEHLNPMAMKEAFLDIEAKNAADTQEIMSLAQYLKGLMSDSPNSNMTYYEALGYAVSHINFDAITNHASFTKAIQKKANAEGFIPHPTKRNMSIIEAFCIAGFSMGFLGKEITYFN